MWDDILKQAARAGKERGELPKPTREFLKKVWPTMVGEELTHLCEPRSLFDGTLTVAVRHPALADEWQRRPMALLRRVQRYAPWPVERLAIELDERSGHRHSPPPPQVVEAFEHGHARVMDEDLDEGLKSLIASIDRLRKARDQG
ncbi:hypothetical protein DL240_04230 [Lujinxingia litoralis]|uniref:DUF721 domain-containing protein n=1 Tax=Lujinxingia litoralis TaxID=2211119 RepID=A0A328CC02_9DELT|nr:DciA family protein [Lujinxingia litoralis]RAL25424.1 hypothetical protein DL240_04230 [Lujinxingia litoralis]